MLAGAAFCLHALFTHSLEHDAAFVSESKAAVSPWYGFLKLYHVTRINNMTQAAHQNVNIKGSFMISSKPVVAQPTKGGFLTGIQE